MKCESLISAITNNKLFIRNQTRVYERTLHDREIDTPYLDEWFEITDDFVQCLDTLEKALEKSLTLLFLQNKSPFR